MYVSSVHTYPVKGCHRIDHGDARVEVEPWGLAGDRRWLITDEDGRALTQRDDAGLVRIHPSISHPGIAGSGIAGSALVLRAAGHPDLVVPAERGDLVDVTVWLAMFPASWMGEAADAWLSVVLDRKVHLHWLDDPRRRPVDPAFGRPDDRVSFADAYPLLLANAASLDALNGWLAASDSPEWPLPMTRFRPNIVVDGAAPWAEDSWVGGRIRIGDVTFRAVKACSRCIVTTTDQETGDRGHEPLRTLARHRNIDHRLLFGLNLIPDGHSVSDGHSVPDTCGSIAAGDAITLGLSDKVE